VRVRFGESPALIVEAVSAGAAEMEIDVGCLDFPEWLPNTSEESPAAAWERDAAKRALDELFLLARRYSTGAEYYSLMQFIARFPAYSPFNALLIQAQMPGASFVATAHRWRFSYGRRIKAGMRPLVILQPMGPVMFVFDVSQTEPARPGASDLPPEVERPFETRGGQVGDELERTIENARRDGVWVGTQEAGSLAAGCIRRAEPGRSVLFQVRSAPPVCERVPLRYEVLLNASHTREVRYATLVHELAHLYCGHLGTPDPAWWPDRRGVDQDVGELEAESVCYLVCARRGIETPSHRYLAGYVARCPEMPPISLDCVVKSTWLIEKMGREALQPRQPSARNDEWPKQPTLFDRPRAARAAAGAR
jgi:hypothetical protein